ncbi:MAG: hypothetical protein KDD82_21440, partial [Planctomycetes bacterium]|nr:hypothetical protein [Planctomycetota bacterium]
MLNRLPFAAVIAVCSIAPLCAQSKPKYRNAQDVEAQGPDGRWYRAKVWKVKKGNPPEYELRFEGMPSDARQWLPETKLRDAGAGEVVDPEAIGAVIGAKQLFQQIVAHGRQGKWEDARWNQELDALTERFEAAVASIKQRWPNEPIADLEPLPAKIRANNELRRAELKQKQGAPVVAGAGAQIEGYYRARAQAADGLPFTLNADSVANCTQDLELLAFGTLEARVAKDAEAYPGVFAYYGKEDLAAFADLPYGGPKAPQIADADLKRVNQFHLPKIYKAKARLLAAQEALADGVKVLMAKGKTVDDAVAAIRFGEAVKGCQPSNPHVDARLSEARALLAERLKAIAPLMKGPFHREHLRELVAFSSRPTLGSER